MIAEEYDCGGLLKLGYQQFDSSLIAASDHICPSVHDTAVLTMSLTTLPMLPLEEIASYLNFSSLVSLAACTSSLAHLTPKEQVVKGDDFSVAGRSYCLRRCCQIAEPSGNQGGLGMEGQSKQKKSISLLLLLMNSL